MGDIGLYPFKQALDFHQGRLKPIRGVVIHATATGESSQVAETIQQIWTTDDGRLASCHTIGDDNSIVRCVHDADTAWHAKGANSAFLGHEIVGQATQTEIQWADPFSKHAIHNAALVTGRWCRAYKIPVRRLTVEQLRDGKTRGICGHADVQKAFPSTGHTDPGPNFPWSGFLGQVQQVVNDLNGSTLPPWYRRVLRLLDPLQRGDDVKAAQIALIRLGHLDPTYRTSSGQPRSNADGVFGKSTARAVVLLQRAHKLTAHPGVIGSAEARYLR